LFDLGYGSILVESEGELDFPQAVLLGEVTDGEDGLVKVNGERISIDRLLEANAGKYAKVYPAKVEAAHRKMLGGIKPEGKYETPVWKGAPVDKPLVYIPVFPGTNCDYDTAKAFRKAGAEVQFGVFRNLTGADVLRSIDEMGAAIDGCQVLMLAGGFSAGDEPDGSGKFIANVLNNKRIAEAIHGLLDRGGLILGICNGFQALVKSGLLPYGRLGCVTKESPTLFRNDINRHISQMATTRVSTTRSPWLAGMSLGDLHTIAVSHGEGKFMVSEELAKQLFANGQVAFQYVNPFSEEVTMEAPFNPNGSYYAIEGIVSPTGQILGKMGHTERWEPGVFKNIEEELYQPLFDNAVAYFKKNQ
ncbi:MAG: phosphoribosylformylglycinamidine synthase subunit PurQ, partial [Bacteroidales bacterium]|nr:phosphoribosylformylglycinamidine synthase subunit PurQ [Bacteroidales bacterium]